MKRIPKKQLIGIGLFVFLLFGSIIKTDAAQKTQTQEFSYESDYVLEGDYGDCLFYFQVPDYWEIENADGDFLISVSPMLVDVPATLTFSINEIPFYTQAVDYRSGEDQQISVPIPKDNLVKGYNVLKVTGYARVYDEEGCIDERTDANWILIKKDSKVNVSYSLAEATYEIKDYPYPILSTENITGKGIQIVVPDEASSSELTAAAWIRMGLSDKLKDQDEIRMVFDHSYNQHHGSAIIVGRYDYLQDSCKELLIQQGIQESRLQEEAAVCMMETKEGRGVIIITSNKEEELVHAAQFLMDEDRISQETGSCIYVKRSDHDLEKKSTVRNWEYTVAELSGNPDGIYLQGPFHQEQTVFLTNSTGHILGSTGSMDLHFRYSENLDFNRAVLTVLVNDVPVASKKLSKELAGNDTLSVELPEDFIGKKITNITFAFELELPDTYCTPWGDDTPWAYLTGESTVFLPVGSSRLFDFEQLPYPFVGGSIFQEVSMVVADQMTAEELQLFGQVMGLYGQGALPYTDLQVKRQSDITNEELTDRHLMILGTFSDLPFLQDVKDELPFAIDTVNGRFLSNEQMLLSESYAKSIATMQMIPSVYNDERVMLIITSPDDKSLTNLSLLFRNLDAKNRLSGDTVVVDRNLGVRSFEYQLIAESMEKPTLRERVKTHQESLLFTLVASSGLILLLIAAVLILIRARAVRKRNR